MLGADVIVVEIPCLVVCQIDYPLRARSELHVLTQAAISSRYLPFDLRADSSQAYAQPIDDSGGNRIVFPHQSEKQMLGVYVILTKPPSLFLREEHPPSRALRESLPHNLCLSLPGPLPA